MRMVFSPSDLARTRFAVSPLWETMAALRVLLEPQRQPYHLPWLDAVRPQLDSIDIEPLLALCPRKGWNPDFLTPLPEGPHVDVADQLAAVRRTPPELVAYELQRCIDDRGDEPASDSIRRLLRDPAAARLELAGLLHSCWKLLLAPHWARLSDLLDADIAHRTRTLAAHGLDRALHDLDRRVQWDGRQLSIDCPQVGRTGLDGRGLVLIPSAFVWPVLTAVTDEPALPRLVYPARGIAALWQPAVRSSSSAVAGLLGSTRALLLESVAEPASTSELARRHQLAPSTVSSHLGALVAARLVTKHRHSYTVYYQQTRLGGELARPAG
jgi:DNA-binding transcriptional ArsR family regulator